MTDGNKEMATNPAMASTEPGGAVTGLIPWAPNAREAERTKLGRVGHEKPGRTERALEN